MQQTEQKQLEEIIEKFYNTDSAIIKSNIIKYIDESPYKNQEIAEQVGVDLQTVYTWRQIKKKTAVRFENALKLCNVLGISITKLMEE